MLLSISIRNFKSVRDTEMLSFDAVKDTRQDDRRLIDVNGKIKLLKTMAVVGPNGAGKSCMVRALEAMKMIVTASEDEQNPTRLLIASSYAFGETKGQPSVISVDFVTPGGELCRYRLVVNMDRIYSESLYRTIDGTKKMMFMRRYKPETGRYRCAFGRFYEYEQRRELTFRLGEKRTVLQRAASLGLPFFQDVYSWFTDILEIKPMGFATPAETYFTKMLTEHPEWSRKLVDFFWSCDVTDIRDVSIMNGRPVFTHTNVSQKYGAFFTAESMSLRRLAVIGVSLFESYEKNKVMVFDDFGMMLHPLVVQHALKLFEDSAKTGRSQLFVVDCNPWLLKDGLMRRDGVYFAEKTNEGTTRYYSLADFKYSLRRLNTQFDYLNGAYGALPLVSEFRYDDSGDGRSEE